MTRTVELYEAMNEFRKAQIANRTKYLEKKKSLDRYTGSVGYADDLKKIQDERNQANAAARAVCKAKIDPIFKAMREANVKRGIEAPSEEALRILSAVKMLEKPSKAFMDCVANSLGGNALALVCLTQIMRDAWKDDPDMLERIIASYSDGRAAKELDPQYVAEAIRDLQDRCNEILASSGASWIREMSADRSHRMHGGQYDPDDLPQEQEYSSSTDFYNREARGLNYDLFCAAVNA